MTVNNEILNPIIIDCGGNNDSNRGDQAVRVCTCRIFEKYLPEIPHLYSSVFQREGGEFTGACVDKMAISPSVYEVKPGKIYAWGLYLIISGLWQYFPHCKISQYMKDATAFTAIAGDILVMDYGRLALRINSAPFYHASRLKTPVFLWGASIGPFPQGSRIERIMTQMFGNLDLILARESETVRYLHTLGLVENVRKVADPAFTLPVQSMPVQGNSPIENESPFLPKEIDDALNAGAVGLDLSPYGSQVSNITPKQWFQQNLEILIDVRKKISQPIILIPHVMMPNWIFPECNDYIFQTKLHQYLPEGMKKDVFVYDPRKHSCMEMKWVISRLLAIASMRTHAAIAGYSSCIPTLAISYSRKSLGINEDIFGQENRDWIVSFKQIKNGKLAELIEKLLEQKNFISDHLHKIIPDYQKTAWKAGEYVADMLRKRGKID
ncbi:MAG: polysaccharide pyruvyl transferase family protein [Planctomycetaceae bacterium]|jgi:polysaccharide pyruvyl transferase WcaK-like protein|nr:polysaccharide pyruvyl transferase family protein [Planctomycetaceae bacterium]